MTNILRISFLFIILFLVGCHSLSKYDNNEVAAIVKGEEITVGELRFLYPDERALDYLDWAIKVELVKQEVKDMDLDYAKHEADDDWFAELPPKDTEDEGGKQIRKFAKAQAKKMKMEPEEFQREYAKRIAKQNNYLVAYFEQKLGEIDFYNEEELEEFNVKGDKLLEDLVKEHEDDIEVFIE